MTLHVILLLQKKELLQIGKQHKYKEKYEVDEIANTLVLKVLPLPPIVC